MESAVPNKKFSMILGGVVRMPGFMNVPVTVVAKVGRRYPDLLELKVVHKDAFHHTFTTSMRQLADGRTAKMHACDSSIGPAEGDRVSIEAHVWHWQIPVEIPRTSVNHFLDAAQVFLSAS